MGGLFLILCTIKIIFLVDHLVMVMSSSYVFSTLLICFPIFYLKLCHFNIVCCSSWLLAAKMRIVVFLFGNGCKCFHSPRILAPSNHVANCSIFWSYLFQNDLFRLDRIFGPDNPALCTGSRDSVKSNSNCKLQKLRPGQLLVARFLVYIIYTCALLHYCAPPTVELILLSLYHP